MSTLSIRLPDSIHREVKELAEADGVSMNQFISLAIAEKVASLRTIEFLRQRASRGSREHLLSLLEAAPDVEPEAEDRIR